MEQKIEQIITLLEELNCPLFKSPINFKEPITEEYQSFIKNYGNQITHLLLPTEERLLLFEWLIQKCDPNLLLNPKIKPMNSAFAAKIEIVLRTLGLISTIKPIQNIIEGKCSLEESLTLLHKVCEFIMTAQVLGLTIENSVNESIKAMTEIYKSKVFFLRLIM